MLERSREHEASDQLVPGVPANSNSSHPGLSCTRCPLATIYDGTAGSHPQSDPAWRGWRGWRGVAHTWSGRSTGPIPGTAWLRASRNSASAARGALSPVADIRAAIIPATSGAENDVPLHFANPLNWRILPLFGSSLHT